MFYKFKIASLIYDLLTELATKLIALCKIALAHQHQIGLNNLTMLALYCCGKKLLSALGNYIANF